MTWGTDLWDRSDVVAAHTQQSIDFIEKVSKFTKERSRIEQDYAKELRKLCKAFHPKKKEESSLSAHKAFLGILKETEDIAGQHEFICEELQSSVYKELQVLHNEAKQERKKFLDGEKGLQQNLKQSMNALENTKRAYEKASKEAQEAVQNFQKADRDMNMTKLQIEKLKSTSMDKGSLCQAAMEAYRDQLSKTNSLQTLHYTTHFPALNDVLQKGEEERMAKYGVLLAGYAEVHAKVVPIINKCLEEMKNAAKITNGPMDSQVIIDANKTGFSPPGDVLFEEYGKPAPQGQGPGTPNDKKRKKVKTQKVKQKNVEGDGNAFQSLNPGDKIRMCKKKVEEFTNQSAQLLSERNALEKMLDVYSKNNALGDPESIKGQLEDNGKRLDICNDELHKYKCYLAALENTSEPAAPALYSGQAPAAPSNGVATPPSNVPSPPPPPGTVEVDQDDGDFEEDVRCYVLYDFQASNEGELTVSAGEELIVLERDIEDSGWTQVLKGDDEGYVPTSYIQLDE